MICFLSPGGARCSGKLARVYFVHPNVLSFGHPQCMHLPSIMRVSFFSGETQGAGVPLSSLSDFD